MKFLMNLLKFCLFNIMNFRTGFTSLDSSFLSFFYMMAFPFALLSFMPFGNLPIQPLLFIGFWFWICSMFQFMKMPHFDHGMMSIMFLPMEVMSFLARPFSLLLRIWFNITMGHVYLHLTLMSMFLFPLTFFLIFYEFAIIFLQVYVFSDLLRVFLSN